MLSTQVDLQQAGCDPVVKSKFFQCSDPGHVAYKINHCIGLDLYLIKVLTTLTAYGYKDSL